MNIKKNEVFVIPLILEHMGEREPFFVKLNTKKEETAVDLATCFFGKEIARKVLLIASNDGRSARRLESESNKPDGIT